MKRFLLGTTAALFFAAPVMAADMPLKAPPPAAVAYSWTGWYIGAYAGGAVTDRDVVTTDPCAVGAVCTAVGSYNGVRPVSHRLRSSGIFGVTSGYNFQSGAWVFGYESEFGFLRLRDSVQFRDAAGVPIAGTSGDTSAHTKIGSWYSAYTARVGMAWDRSLLYVKGGAAVARISTGVVDNCVTAVVCGAGTVNTTREQWRVGWAAGAGGEYALQGNWSIKAEYLYLGLRRTESHSGLGGGTFAGTTLVSTSTIPGVHTAKIGLNYRFGPGTFFAGL